MFVIKECWNTDFMAKIIIYHLVFNIFFIWSTKVLQKGTFSSKVFEIIKLAIILINLLTPFFRMIITTSYNKFLYI